MSITTKESIGGYESGINWILIHLFCFISFLSTNKLLIMPPFEKHPNEFFRMDRINISSKKSSEQG